MTIFVDFEPTGRRGECSKGITLLDCARTLGVDLVNVCGGEGSCGSCIVQVLKGEVSPVNQGEQDFLAEEEIDEGYRLACYTVPQSDCKIRIPPKTLATKQRMQVEGQEKYIEPDPVAKTYKLNLTPPSLDDLRSDTERIADFLADEYGLKNMKFDYDLLCHLASDLRKNEWSVKVVVYQNEVIALMPDGCRPLGVAVDLGTTKIAMYLIDLDTGETLTREGIMNPQIAYGEDIMTRMTAANADPVTAAKFQSLVVDSFNETIAKMCETSSQNANQIVNIVVVGNTAMHHMFLNFPVYQLGRAPYIPEVSTALDIKVRDLGIKTASGGYVHLLPNIAGYVGADHVSMLLASEIQNKPGVVLAIDIGTNTEICLSNHGAMSSLSTASGPAFEGAHIKCGMRAAAGAIERFQFINGENTFQTIGNVPPIGICGSGILDILAALLKEKIVNPRGKLMDHPRVHGNGINREYIIFSDEGNGRVVSFSQTDIEQLQLAKGAIRTGIDVLLSERGLSSNEIDEIIIAGAFGTYLDVRSAIEIGMLPNVPIGKVNQVGNAAGIGAKQALISDRKREEALNLAELVEYIELAGNNNFLRFFAKSMRLGGKKTVCLH